MKYYTYTPSGTTATLVGISKGEISSSVNPFLASIGKRKIFTVGLTVSEVEHLTMKAGNPNQFNQIVATVRDGFELMIDYDAFVNLVPLFGSEQGYSRFMKENKLGKLYRFNIFYFSKQRESTWLLPEYIIQGIQQHNWDQYTEWMSQYHAQWKRKLEQARESQQEKVFTFGFRKPK